MTDAKLTALQKQIGSKNGVLQFDLTLSNPLLALSTFDVTFPEWNPLAPKSQRLPMITVDTPECKGISANLPKTLTCSFDASANLLKISGLT